MLHHLAGVTIQVVNLVMLKKMAKISFAKSGSLHLPKSKTGDTDR